MKTLTFLLSALVLALSLQAAPKQPAEIPRNDFVPQKGDWNKPKNWSLGHVPKDESAKIVKGALVKLDASVPEIDSLSVGSRTQPSTLVLEDGANIKVRTVVSIWCNAEDGQSRFHMKGGQMETGDSNHLDGAFLVGTGNTYSGMSIATLSGGKLIGSVLIGSTLLNTHKGKLLLDGSGASVLAGSLARSHFLVATHGVIEFVFDDKGVGFFDYAASPANNRLMAGSTVVVDGSKYQGGARVIPLFTASRMDDEGARIEVKGFAPVYKTEILKMYRRVPGLYIKISLAK